MTMQVNRIRGSVINKSNAIVEPTDDGIIEDLNKQTVRHGEEALMLAVLMSCVEDFQKYIGAKDKKGRQLFSQAEEWIMQKDSEYPFSFENICEVLRFNPDYLRKGLLSWKRAKWPCGQKPRAA